MEASSAANFVLRPLEEGDRELLFLWRNLPEIIDLSASQTSVEWCQHQAWFDGALGDGNPVVYIVLEDRNPIGQIRFDLVGRKATMSIYLIGKNPGRGRGASLISAGIQRLKIDRSGVAEVIANIRKINERSIRAFLSAGFELDSDADNRERQVKKYRLRIL